MRQSCQLVVASISVIAAHVAAACVKEHVRVALVRGAAAAVTTTGEKSKGGGAGATRCGRTADAASCHGWQIH